MSRKSENEGASDSMEKVTVTLPATVEKIIPSLDPKEPEKAQIHIEGAEPLYRELRIDNALVDEAGEEAKLKIGSHVEVTIEAEGDAILPKGHAANKA
jgi:hypothetical protein